MKISQVLIIAASRAEFQEYSKPYFEKGYLMLPESLRIVIAPDGGCLLAVIMEKETSSEPPAPSGT